MRSLTNCSSCGSSSFQVDHFQIAALREIALLVENVGDTAAHTGRKVASGAAKNDHPPARHVLAPVIADTFDNSDRSAVSNREPLAGDAANVRFAGRSAIENDVADKDVLFRFKRCRCRLEDYQSAAGKAFAEIVIRIAFQCETDSFRQKRAETLSR